MKHRLARVKTPAGMGFWKGYGCFDLAHCLRMICQRRKCWGEVAWFAPTASEKAFDTIVHAPQSSGDLEQRGCIKKKSEP
eukprot:5587206-Pyramimonas_sp.AAC.1